MNYGHFDDTQREYVITRPDTPRPWSNYLGSADFGGVITHHAAGYCFYKSADQGRLTRFRFNSTPAEWSGRYVYLRDREDGDFWSASWMPVVKPLEAFGYECRHGTGYSVISSVYRDIRCEVTYCVPPGALYEVWRIRLSTCGDRPRCIDIFPTVEPQCNWSATDDNKNLQYNQYIAQTRLVDGMIDIGSNVNMPADPDNFTNKDQKRHRFFALAGARAAACDADLAAFFGPYGGYAAPRAVVEGACSNSTAYGDMPFGAFQVGLELPPGGTTAFCCLFGIGSADTDGRAARAAMSDVDAADDALQRVRAYWHGRLDALAAETPDAGFNSMVNTWAPYNNLMTFYWSRTASLVYAGERDGLGFRDTLQDLVGSAALVTEETRERLELLLTGQYADGACKPVVQPFHHHPGREAYPEHLRADDGMWFFNAVPAYVKETGDVAFYRKVLPFADAGEASVFAHLRRAIEFNLNHSGAHGLPCGLFADWNDCIRLGQQGETVFVAMQLRLALREYAAIAGLLDEPDEAAWATARLAGLDAAIQKHAWDGEWYLRAYRFDGLKFGSRECEEGRIFMNPQTWAILSGHATGERATRILHAMHDNLATEYGIMLCAPPYVKTDPEVCLGRLFNPGTKENGGIFNHTQGWAVMAAALLGDGDRAWEYLHNVLPARFNDIAEVREVEPYAVCQSTHSRFSPRFGAGRVSWLSGSAVWNYVAMTHAILGIQPDYQGLRLDPCIPKSWPGFTARRAFRGATYAIEVHNPNGRCKGIRKLMVDGQPHTGNLIPARPSANTVHVLAVM
jgi:N,N'-diacetylchitobiose phosphorylase